MREIAMNVSLTLLLIFTSREGENSAFSRYPRRIPFFAVALCLILSAAVMGQESEVIEQILAPASSSSIRKTEGAIVELKDGRLLLGYTDFYTVSPNDDAPARILGRHSSDLGKTWGPAFTIVENTAKMNVMSVSLLRLQSGEVALAYMFKDSHEDCYILYRLSQDEGKTFSEPVKITPRKSFWVMNNDRLVQL